MSRKEAFLAGERFYEGKPCKLGHTRRYTRSYQCVACQHALIKSPYWPAYAKYWRDKNPDKVRATRQRYAAKEPPAQLQARRDRASAKRRALLINTLLVLGEDGYQLVGRRRSIFNGSAKGEWTNLTSGY